MRMALTAKTIDALKPKAKRYEIHDVLCPGLSVRVSKQGIKIFTQKYRYGLKQKRLKLGTYPRVSLADARTLGLEAMRQVDQGIDPSLRRRQLDMRVEAIFADYIRLYASKRNRSWQETERILRREFVAVHGQQDIRDVTRADIIAMLDAAVERGADYQANRLHAQLRRFFGWCVERNTVEISPVAGTRAPTREKPRDRVLTDHEIKAVLKACDELPYPYRQFVPMLLATAQRRGEVSKMCWRDIDLEQRIWVVPAELSKNGQPNVVPLNDFALRLLAETPRYQSCGYVFTTGGRTHMSSFSKTIKRIHEASGTSDWRFHDLRRTAASGMARLSVAPHVIEKVLNHLSGTLGGIHGVYNRYGYDAEKRDALMQWGAFLDRL